MLTLYRSISHQVHVNQEKNSQLLTKLQYEILFLNGAYQQQVCYHRDDRTILELHMPWIHPCQEA